MKKALISLLILILGISVTAQELTKEEYLRKSKNQKTAGWILTAGGGALLIGGIAVTATNSDFFATETFGPIMIGAGAAVITGGIVLFSASKRNENKANEMNVALKLKLEEARIYEMVRAVNYIYPAVSISINFK